MNFNTTPAQGTGGTTNLFNNQNTTATQPTSQPQNQWTVGAGTGTATATTTQNLWGQGATMTGQPTTTTTTNQQVFSPQTLGITQISGVNAQIEACNKKLTDKNL